MNRLLQGDIDKIRKQVATDLILCQANQAKKVKEQVEVLMDDDETPNES
jgi:hypothetical protein